MKSIFELKTGAKQKIREKMGRVLWCTLGYMLFSFVLQVLVMRLSGYTEVMSQYSKLLSKAGNDPTALYELMNEGALSQIAWPQLTAVAGLLIIAIGIITMLLDAGYENISLRLSRREEFKFKSMFDVFNSTGRAFLICFLRNLLTGIGAVLFIIPGLVIAYQYRLAVLIMYDNPDMGAVECLRQSRALMRGHKMDLFLLELSFIGWVILDIFLSMLFAPVVQLWLTPYMGVSRADFYNELIGRTDDTNEGEPREPGTWSE